MWSCCVRLLKLERDEVSVTHTYINRDGQEDYLLLT